MKNNKEEIIRRFNQKEKWEEPIKEDYGWVESTGFDSEPSGFMIEGGEEAYEEAMEEWNKYKDYYG